MVADRGEQDLRAAVGEHAPQSAGVIMHLNLADAGQGHRAAAVVVADTNRWRAALAVLVAQPK